MAKSDRLTLQRYVGDLRDTADPSARVPLRVLFDIYDEEVGGKSGGRPKMSVNDAELQRAIRLNDAGRCTADEAARMLGVSRRTYFRLKKRETVEGNA